MYRCYITHMTMPKHETPEDVQRWFSKAIQRLWPVALGSISLRKSPCIRDNCSACESGIGHSTMHCRAIEETSAFPFTCPRSWCGTLKKQSRMGGCFFFFKQKTAYEMYVHEKMRSAGIRVR